MAERYTVVVLANLDPPAAQRVAGYIRDRLEPAREATPDGAKDSPGKADR